MAAVVEKTVTKGPAIPCRGKPQAIKSDPVRKEKVVRHPGAVAHGLEVPGTSNHGLARDQHHQPHQAGTALIGRILAAVGDGNPGRLKAQPP